MTEYEPEIVEYVRKKKRNMEITMFGLFAVGAAIVFFAFVMPTGPTFFDMDQMTDPSIPVSELDNATYTWTHDEIEEAIELRMALVLIGAGIVFAGYPLLFLTMGDKEFHRKCCKLDPEDLTGKYCPECGLKLSKLEKK